MDIPFDPVLVDIADYVEGAAIDSRAAYATARLCLMDSLGCGLLALSDPQCSKFLGPIVPGSATPDGARVPGTPFVLDPVKAAFDIGCLIRWLDLNDTWLAAEWGHPSDNLGGLLAVADFVSRQRLQENQPPLKVKALLEALVKAYEIQGILALENSFNRIGLDHVLLVRVATAALSTWILGGHKAQILSAISNAWVDGGSLRVYRHAPNAGMRKSWAAGDATSRGVRLALLALRGEPGYPTALSAETWGFYEVFCKGRPFSLPRPYGSYVMENILFKPFPAEFHAQTAVECALGLHPRIKDRLDNIEQIWITTQEPALRIIDKTGPLHNPADRDHCLQYMVAVALIFGELTAAHYQDEFAADPRIDRLRARMTVVEDPNFSQDYLDPAKRSVANALQIRFREGSTTERIVIEYPLGHPRRRTEAIPGLLAKFKTSLASRLPLERCQAILDLCSDPERFDETPVNHWMDLFVSEGAFNHTVSGSKP
jgi:2-methylcitrate dehydratase